MQRRIRLALTASDSKRYLEHAFDVPGGTRALRVSLDFAPAVSGRVRNMLCLSVFGPDGFRGAGHRHRPQQGHDVVIAHDWATPGYLPGPIQAGRWTIEIDTHMIHGDEGCVADLLVEALPAAPRSRARADGAARSRPPSGSRDTAPLPPLPPGWLRGDIHAHSRHSDAAWDVADLLAAARALGLGFVALSDHNTVSGLRELEDDALLTLPGMELTTFWGHALALGLDRWTDWRTGEGRRTMAQVAQDVADQGGVFVIAHPFSAGDPTCTGCRWLYPDVSPGPARHVEIFNGGLSERRNAEALALWYGWLNAGHQVLATSGTDAHHAGHMVAGRRFNVLRCERPTASAVLDALAAGRSYVSRGPHLTLEAGAGAGTVAGPGDTLAPGRTRVTAGWEAAEPSSTARLIVNGAVRAEWPAGDGPPADARPKARRTGEPGKGAGRAVLELEPGAWCLLELRDAQGELAAVTNPVRARP